MSLPGSGASSASGSPQHHPSGRRRRLTYSEDDASHPHNDPEWIAADDEDARKNGVLYPYGMWMMASVFINYVIDTGALGIPYAFVQSGWVLSCFTLIACGIMSTITVIYTLESMARATGILEWKERQDRRWRKKKRRDDSVDSDVSEGEEGLSDYEEGEEEEEKEVLHELGESLRQNRRINPNAARYGTVGDVAESPSAFTPLTDVRSDEAQSNDADDELQSPEEHLLPNNTPSPVPVGESSTGMTSATSDGNLEHKTASPVRGSLQPGRHHHSTSAPFIKSNSGHHLSSHSVNEESYLGLEPHSSLSSSSHGRARTLSSPQINPIAQGRGYPINSPAHDPAHVHLVLHNKPIHHLSYRSTDFTLMSQLFGGYPLAALTQFSITIFSYVSLWVTAAIFAQSVDTLFFQYIMGQDCNIYVANQSAGCYSGYYIIVAIYSVIVIFLSLKDLTETASMQAVLTGYRFAAFFAMGITCLIASVYPNYFNSPDGKHPAAWSPFNSEKASEIPEVNWNQFDSIFTISVVSLMVQYNMPDIITPMRTPFKRHESGVVAVLLGSMMACVALYMGLGLICSLTIGNNSYPLITLNWAHYTGYNGGWGLVPEGHDVYWWAQVIKLFIMLFPVINMLSVFPLVAISLSENLRSSIPLRYAKQHSAEDLKKYCRILACIPPLILTCFNGQIDLIFKVAGFVAFLIQLIIPCLLQWLSMRYCQRIWGAGSEVTPFSFRLLSNSYSVFVVFMISCAFAVYSIFAMANEDDSGNPGQ